MAEKENQFGFESTSTPVGQYYLLDKIAQGGMAEIYKGLAYDLHGIKRTVVIKKILPQIAADPEFINMLINEAKIAVMLNHGNIAQIYDLGKVGEDYFMVMEYVEGKSLSKIHKRSFKEGHLIPIEYACYIVSEVAKGLDYMHRRTDESGKNLGIIHRDISPQNIIISYSGTVKIIDFGIAKAAIQLNITESGVLKGKFAYMSPEQAKGEPIDHRSDIYSLGVILFELLTGKRLFKGKTKKETLQNVRKGYVPTPSSIKRGLPERLDKIVLKALAKDRKKRYMWASEFHDDLIRFIYSNYLDFKSSGLIDYVDKLFKYEKEKEEELEEEAKTPFLIIDHTQSALMSEEMEDTNIAKIPAQLREFMLEEETPSSKEDFQIAESLIDDEEDKDERKDKIPEKEGKKKRIKGVIAAIIVIISFLAGLFFFSLQRGWITPPKILSAFFEKSRLILKIKPRDARVLFDGTSLKGSPPYKIKDIEPDRNYRLIVEKDDYLPYSSSVALKKGETKKIEVELQKEPPHYGELIISSEPPGATIFLNEENTNLKTPATISHLEPNNYYTIGLFLNDYQYWTRDILLKKDEEKVLNASLEYNYGELAFSAKPKGASVYLNGKFEGKTPLVIGKIKPGKIINVKVVKKGYIDWEKTVKIKAGKRIFLKPNLDFTKESMIPHFLRDLKSRRKHPKRRIKEKSEMLSPAPIE